KKCGVKITTFICGVPSYGSGVVYETPNYCNYNYILTAKHIFQEDSQTPFNLEKISNVEIFYSDNEKLSKLQQIKKKDLFRQFIVFDEDLVIIIIDKNVNVNFSQILVSDKLEDDEEDFFSWAIFSANKNEMQIFTFKRNDYNSRRLELNTPTSQEALQGISGAGVFFKNKNILYGIISRYPNDNFENSTVDCTRITFNDINIKLKLLNRIQLDTQSSSHKREINKIIVDINQATINEVCLDLDLAQKRLKTDMIDDWYHDPLKYIDLLNKDYLFKQFEEYFDENKYQASQSEQFYVPKKKFTLRSALISPFIDRIMYMAVVGTIAEKLDNALIPNVYSARYNKFSPNQLILLGVEQWKKMKYILEEKVNLRSEKGLFLYDCIIEIDLLNFYDNIHKKLLIEKIERVCETANEKKACKLLGEILNKLSNKDSGLPQNSDASALLATFYLNQVDLFMQNSTFGYFRFMDDIRIFCKNKYEARKILQTFELELRRCHLSVNSQKTNILSIVDVKENTNKDEILREEFSNIFELEINEISRLRKSSNYAYLNQAFHQSIRLLEQNINEDLNNSEDSSRKLNYALNTIELLCKKNINLYSINQSLKKSLLSVTESLKDKPWLTPQICKVLNLITTEDIIKEFLIPLKQIILDDNYNTYSFQTYQVWLLLAKHKYKSPDLIQYAVKNIEKNDETNKAVIAAMIIYICSIDNNYKRVILRKFIEKFTHGYFQNRIALISLRSFDPEKIPLNHINASLKNAPEFTNIYKNKDLIYVQGFEEGDEDNYAFEQLYSI
ncbi:MAG TPA: reverse transcriptase domain-containing protein, partial [Saprospiraceae bacterium]|nr:reverse transcriptase domain-containing protein [Saprospiraceae bacterium]